MSTFNAEQIKTSEKMSDLVMEYVSQFIARDFLEVYERVGAESSGEFVPAEFDDKMYKKITKIIRKNTGQNIKTLRFVIFLFTIVVCALCVIFTVMVLMHDMLRGEIVDIISSWASWVKFT